MDHTMHYYATYGLMADFLTATRSGDRLLLEEMAWTVARANAMVDWAKPANLGDTYHQPGLPYPVVTQVEWLGDLLDTGTDPYIEIWRRFHFPPSTAKAPGLVEPWPYDMWKGWAAANFAELPADVSTTDVRWAAPAMTNKAVSAGVCMHVGMDSYAHRGFSALRGPWNRAPVKGSFWSKVWAKLRRAAPATGHAQFGSVPDQIDADVWSHPLYGYTSNRSLFLLCIDHIEHALGEVTPYVINPDFRSVLSRGSSKQIEECVMHFVKQRTGRSRVFTPFSPTSAEWSRFCTACADTP